MPPAASGADPPWIGDAYGVGHARRCARDVGSVQQVPTGHGQSISSISHNRPSVDRQGADDVSRATIRGMMEAQNTRD